MNQSIEPQEWNENPETDPLKRAARELIAAFDRGLIDDLGPYVAALENALREVGAGARP